jgi:hypothetical protein
MLSCDACRHEVTYDDDDASKDPECAIQGVVQLIGRYIATMSNPLRR